MAQEHTSEDANGPVRWIPWLVGIGVLIWLVAMCGRRDEVAQVSAPAPAVVAAPAAEPAAPAVAPAPATVQPPAAIPSAKIFFEVAKTNLPKDAADNLRPVVEYLKANGASKAVLSGFHDPTGNKAQNEELAKERAKAVRGALKAASIDEARVVMQKPQETTGTGNDAEARRVEVTIQQ